MKDYNGTGKKSKRASRGTGTLYKRDSKGKEHPASWNGGGAFYLAYTIPAKDCGKDKNTQKALNNEDGTIVTGDGKGRRIRQALKDADGKPILYDRELTQADNRPGTGGSGAQAHSGPLSNGQGDRDFAGGPVTDCRRGDPAGRSY